MAVKKTLKFIIFFLFLSGCSSVNFEKLKKISEQYKNQDKEILEIKKTDLINVHYPVLEARTNHIIKRVLMLPISTRNDYKFYSNGGSQALTLKGALVTKTIGFDAGLISLELDDNSPLVKETKYLNWPKTSIRKYSYITHLNSSKTVKFECEINSAQEEEITILEDKIKLFKIHENCNNIMSSFTNTYWLNDDGKIIKSIQKISEKNIYLTITFLK